MSKSTDTTNHINLELTDTPTPVNIELSEYSGEDVAELGKRIDEGTAFIINTNGMSRKERREAKREAFTKLKDKKHLLSSILLY